MLNYFLHLLKLYMYLYICLDSPRLGKSIRSVINLLDHHPKIKFNELNYILSTHRTIDQKQFIRASDCLNSLLCSSLTIFVQVHL